MVAHNRGLLGLMKGALRLVYPPQCICCANPVGEEGALCAACWTEADFIGASCCARCGAPLPGEGLGDDDANGLLTCDDCMAVPRPWLRGRAVLTYHGTGRKLVLMLKNGDRLDLAPALGDWVARAAAPMVRPEMVVIPVPLHLRRMARRKYNQAAMLAQRVAQAHGLKHMPHALKRVRHTPRQDHGTMADRFSNIEGAIALTPRFAQQIEGRAVLLVDDVMTSGATLTASAQALRAAGAGPICVVVLARAVRDT